MKVKLNGNDFFEVSTKFGITDEWHNTVHNGIDLVMNTGTELFSPVSGTISKVVDYGSENIGKGVFIKTDSGENVIMGHLSDIKASVGDRVSEGDLVALSGNTGHSTGSHLHLGLKDTDGTFLNPESLTTPPTWFDKFIENGEITKGGGNIANNGWEASNYGTWDILREWKATGSFWQAMYGKSFFEVIKDGFIELMVDLYNFIIMNGDFFFICPAIIIMFATFIIGRNKYTKWIVPLWFGYFVSVILLSLGLTSHH